MPIKDPLRLRILKNLTALLETINKDTDPDYYSKSMVGRVFRGRAVYGESDPIPMISVMETPVDIEQIISPESSTASSGPWDLLIQGFLEDDSANPTDKAYFLIADVKRVLALERKKRARPGPIPNSNGILGLGSLVEDIYIGAGTVRPPDEVSATAYFWLRITLKIVEDNENPFV